MIDKDCKPWLIEVNNKPSMAAESEFDRKLKASVIQGAMHIINLQPNFKKCINQRIKELSQSKPQVSPNLKFYDPEKETLRSMETHWKQLYPLLEGDTSDIEKGMMAARKASGFRPRKEPNQSIVQNVVEKQPVQPPPRKIMTPSQRIIRPVHRLEKQQTTSSSIPQNKVINRTSQKSLSIPKVDEGPCVLQMKDLPSNFIIEEEERERIKNMRKQAVAAVNVSCLQRINAMLSVVGSNYKKPYYSNLPLLSVFPQFNHSDQKPAMKPLVLKQYNLSDINI